MYFQGDEYMIRKIADGRMAPAPGEVHAALLDTPHSCPSAAVALTVAAPASATASVSS